jgi:hypothetical protein
MLPDGGSFGESGLVITSPNKMSDGWIKIHRKMRKNPIYGNPISLKIWIECLFAATHVDIKIDYCGKETVLKKGWFVFGRLEWAKRLKIPASTINDWICKLVDRGMISRQVTRQGKSTIFEVKNWEKYQEPDRSGDSKVTAGRQLADTNNNYKNYKKDTYGKNPIREDPDYVKLKALDLTTDHGSRLQPALLDKLNRRYPLYRFEKEWNDLKI